MTPSQEGTGAQPRQAGLLPLLYDRGAIALWVVIATLAAWAFVALFAGWVR